MSTGRGMWSRELVARPRRAILPGTEPFIHGLARLLAAVGSPEGEEISFVTDAEQGAKVETMLLRGILAESRGEIERALRTFVRAAELAPQHGPARLHLGRVLGLLGNYHEAEATLKAAIRLDPGAVEPRFVLADVLSRADRLTDAIAALRDAVQLQPARLVGHLRLAELLATAGRLDEACACLERAHARLPDQGLVLEKLAELRLRLGDLEGVVAALREQVRVQPGRERPYVNLAIFALASRDHETATRSVDALLERRPESWRGLYLRSMLNDLAEQDTRALSDMSAALRCAPPGWQPSADLAALTSRARARQRPPGVDSLRVRATRGQRYRDRRPGVAARAPRPGGRARGGSGYARP